MPTTVRSMEGLCEAQSPKARPPHATPYPKARATQNEPKGGRVGPNDKTCAGQESCQSPSAGMPVARCPATMNNRPIRSYERYEPYSARLHKPQHASDLGTAPMYARGHCSRGRHGPFPRANEPPDKPPSTELRGRITFDMSGRHRLAGGCPLDGGVRHLRQRRHLLPHRYKQVRTITAESPLCPCTPAAPDKDARRPRAQRARAPCLQSESPLAKRESCQGPTAGRRRTDSPLRPAHASGLAAPQAPDIEPRPTHRCLTFDMSGSRRLSARWRG